MGEELLTPVSGHDDGSITIRGRDLASEVMGELGFGEAAYLIITGDVPTRAEREVFGAMLSSLLAHGMTSHAVAARVTFGAEPKSVQGAVASGILGVGSRSAGAIRECAAQLQSLVAAGDTDAAVADLAADAEPTEPFGVRGFPGIGHGHFDSIDPRAETVLGLAEEESVAGEHVRTLKAVKRSFEEAVGAPLPINVIGADAAVASDMGLSPVAAQGIAIISRTAGLVAEVEAERTTPMAGTLRRMVQGSVRYQDE